MSVIATPTLEEAVSGSYQYQQNLDQEPATPSNYKTPLAANQDFVVCSFQELYPYDIGDGLFGSVYYSTNNSGDPFITIYIDDEEIATVGGISSGSTYGVDESYTIDKSLVKAGSTIKLVYKGHITDSTGATVYGYYFYITTYTFAIVENKNPLKKWTITSVINRLLDLAEPIRKGEISRFRLSGMTYDSDSESDTYGTYQPTEGQALKFDNILAPQFSFTKQTLRECLQEIGGVIHGEPRMKIETDDDGEYYYEISFDMYGGMKKWKHANHAYIRKTYTQQIENYCTSIDTAAENLVNALGADNAGNDGGTITEPYSGGFKTVRCDTLYERITEDNMIISTALPIYSIEKVECAYNSDFTNYVDITAYVFESSLYNTQLSSYQSEYPYSKAYGLKYTQGSKNIECLNFKQDSPISSIFENYAIVNILRQVTGVSDLDIAGDNGEDYPLLAFRITYTPFYSARVGQTKPYYKEFPRGAALIYNQQSNVIESRFYGENLKGAVARLGNTDITLQYEFTSYGQIPKAGMLFDDDYYISTVEVEYLPTIIKCQIGLSKDFNRLSSYIGISSEKRYSEVSQTQAQERNVLIKEYMLITTDSTETSDTDVFLGRYGMFQIMAALMTHTATYNDSTESTTYSVLNIPPITNVVAWGETGQENSLKAVQLPVIASAFGNSISFTWSYADNYSAGAKAVHYTGTETGYTGVSGYFENNVQYCDYYGRLYYYHFVLQPYGTAATEAIALALPEYDGDVENSAPSDEYISTEYTTPLVIRKDNREILQFNYQIDFVTDNNSIIIGSALASNCAMVRYLEQAEAGTTDGTYYGYTVKLYIFPERLNKFINKVDGNSGLSVTLSGLTGYDITTSYLSTNKVSVTMPDGFAESGKAWAIVTEQTTDSETVEDEQGNTYEQTYTYGGEVLLAQNIDITAGDSFTPIYLVPKREIFDKTVWVDKH